MVNIRLAKWIIKPLYKNLNPRYTPIDSLVSDYFLWKEKMAHITRIKAGDSKSKTKDPKKLQDPKITKEEEFSNIGDPQETGRIKEIKESKKIKDSKETKDLKDVKNLGKSKDSEESTNSKNPKPTKNTDSIQKSANHIKLSKLEKAQQRYEKKKLKKQQKLAKKAKRKANKKPMPKALRILTAPFRKIGSYFGNSWQELRQVRWPNRKTTWKLVSAVITYTLIFAFFIMLLDAGFTLLFNNLLK